jgi:Lon protease-like protein
MPCAAQAQAAAAPATPATLPSSIPIFPLDDVMLFPNMTRPLHIFEPRYKQMVADAIKGDRVIGMVLLQPGHEAEYEGRPPVFAIGCAGVISAYEEEADGHYNIILRGVMKFRILSEDQGRPYRLARIEPLPEPPDSRELAALGKQRERIVALLGPNADPPPIEFNDEDVVNALSQYVQVDAAERQGLLELKGTLARSEGLIKLLEQR